MTGSIRGPAPARRNTAMRRVRAVREHPHQSALIVVNLERFPVSSSWPMASATDCVLKRAMVQATRAIEPHFMAVTGAPHHSPSCDRGDLGLDSNAQFDIGHSLSLSYDWSPSSKRSDPTLMAWPTGRCASSEMGIRRLAIRNVSGLPSPGECMAGFHGHEVGTRSESTESKVSRR